MLPDIQTVVKQRNEIQGQMHSPSEGVVQQVVLNLVPTQATYINK